MKIQLNNDQQQHFERLEKICVDGRAIFFMVAIALEEIKRNKFYEAKGFGDFAAYCESIGYSKRHANQLISDAAIISELPENLRSVVQSERAARELGKIPQALRVGVVTEAAAAGPVTAPAIKRLAPPPRKAAAPSAPPPRKSGATAPAAKKPAAKAVVKDATGLPVPEESLELWNRMADAQQLITMISAVRGELKKAQESGDRLFCELDFSGTAANLNQAYLDIQRAKPYAVCPECQGKLPQECDTCGKRGFVSEFYWKHNVPEEKKALRAKLKN